MQMYCWRGQSERASEDAARQAPQLIPVYDDNICFPRFLQQQYLRSEEEGKEEVTLQLLLNVSAQCGVCFPCNSSLATTSIPLVHAVRDDTLLEVFTSYIWFYFIGSCNLEFI